MTKSKKTDKSFRVKRCFNSTVLERSRQKRERKEENKRETDKGA